MQSRSVPGSDTGIQYCNVESVDSYLALQTAQPTGLTVKYCISGSVKREPL